MLYNPWSRLSGLSCWHEYIYIHTYITSALRKVRTSHHHAHLLLLLNWEIMIPTKKCDFLLIIKVWASFRKIYIQDGKVLLITVLQTPYPVKVNTPKPSDWSHHFLSSVNQCPCYTTHDYTMWAVTVKRLLNTFDMDNDSDLYCSALSFLPSWPFACLFFSHVVVRKRFT